MKVGQLTKKSPERLKSARKRRGRKSRGKADTPGSVAIRALLAYLDITISELAEIVGVTDSAAGRWTYGMRPSKASIDKLVMLWPDRFDASLWGHDD